MTDYKKMYHLLLRATAQAADILIAAQKEAEEMYLSSGRPEITVLPTTRKKEGPD